MQKNIIYLFIIFNIFTNTIFSQTGLSTINNEIDKIREEMKGEVEEIVAKEVAPDIKEIILTPDISSPIKKDKYFFGYDYFIREINFFDNIPTPSDFKLGPGDEITLSMWGAYNSRENLVINKEGLIYYSKVGFINLSNKSIIEAENILRDELSKIYSTLKDNDIKTELTVELSKIRSINIYFSGELFNPGIHLIHPFSDIFSAIIQVGGINNDGSLREIQLIRNGTIISKVDFYSFFLNGKNNFSDIKLIDGDIIHIPNVKKRVLISGEVNRPAAYEILPNETISDIVRFASGFTSDASSTLILSQIIPLEQRSSDDNARTKIAINFKNKESIILNNGDSIVVPSISPVDLNIDIYGQVKSPGSYPGANTTLKNVLDIAGGFDDPIFRKTIREDSIIILRRDENQFYSKEIEVDYKNADQFKLEVNDKIFIYEDKNYSNNYTYRVEGEVKTPGTYAINKRSLTVSEAISLAGGLTELTSERNIIVKQEFTEVNPAGIIRTFSRVVNNANLDFEIGINSVIIASPFENIVKVEGNVYSPGLITYEKGYRYPRYIELAGGYKTDTLKRKSYIKRANGNIEKVNGFFISRGKKVYPGDTIVVPVNPNPQDFDITTFISDLSTTLANIAAILLIVDNTNK